MSRSAPLLALALLGGAPGVEAQDLRRLSPVQLRHYRAIKPTRDELKWQQVPWLLDLNEGLEQARAEKRPLVIWTSDGEPLERC